MSFKLWHKLALTIVGITSIILILALILSQQSVKSGFLDYLNEIEESRISNLSNRLINDYEFYGDWGFIEGKRRLWGRYVRQSRPGKPAGSRAGRPPPPLHELGKRPRDEHLRPPLPPPSARRPPPPREYRADGGVRPPEGERARGGRFQEDRHRRHPPPGMRPPPPPQIMSLLDKNKQRLMGSGVHTEDAINRPLALNGQIIGYLRVEPFTQIVDELDQQFIEHQKQAFIKIALAALLLTLIGAWLLAHYLRRRIDQIGDHARQLMAGQYTEKITHTSTDELGQLANHLNHLGKTLHENRQSKQQWIADISHELRTPLAILRGQVEALEDGIRPLDNKAVQLLGGEVKRLGQLVDDLYQLSLSDLGALAYVKETVNLAQLIEEMTERFQERLNAKQLDLQLSLTECSNASILGDPQRLRQLFINVLENSIRYTHQGGCIKISCTISDEISTTGHDKMLILRIEDSTPGVPYDQLERLFNRLYRGENSRNRSTGGAGLGLAIVKSIVEAHEGTLSAGASSLGGLALELRFPLS